MATVINDQLHADLPTVQFQHIVSHVEGSKFEKLLFVVRALWAFFTTSQVDAVHIHVASAASFYRKSLFVWAARLRGKPAFLHVHGSNFNSFYTGSAAPLRAYIRWVFAQCARTLVLSETWRQFFTQHIVQNRVEVLHNGVHVDRFEECRTPMVDTSHFLFLGRLGVRKGVYDLLEAIDQLVNQHQQRHLRFLLAGDGELAEVQALIDAKQLQEQVQVLGWIDSQGKMELLKQVSTMVLPSHNENLPMAILEAMAAGKVIISTTVGGIPDLVKSGTNGFLITPGDVPALSSSILQVSSNPTLAARIGACNIACVSNSFNLRTINEQLAQLYQAAIAEAAGTVR
ncbi:glycosyltransferase family 4 protein [Hymenobacter glaciei]|uniref:Glycosyltransferase family 4 protein n=2 Tax=Hymenobacter glaciei TaxID=877209 RepID=A0ABP7TNW3_9BACT